MLSIYFILFLCINVSVTDAVWRRKTGFSYADIVKLAPKMELKLQTTTTTTTASPIIEERDEERSAEDLNFESEIIDVEGFGGPHTSAIKQRLISSEKSSDIHRDRKSNQSVMHPAAPKCLNRYLLLHL